MNDHKSNLNAGSAFIHEGRALTLDPFPDWEPVITPKDAQFELLFNKVLDYIQTGDTKEAQNVLFRAYEVAITKEGYRKCGAFHKLAKLYWQLGDIKTAKKICQDAFEGSIPRPRSKSQMDHFIRDETWWSWDVPFLFTLTILTHEDGESISSANAFEIVREIYGSRNELWMYADTLNELGVVYSVINETKARDFFMLSRRLKRIIGNRSGYQTSSSNLSVIDTSYSRNEDLYFKTTDVEAFLGLNLTGLDVDMKNHLYKQRCLPKTTGQARRLLERSLVSQYRNLSSSLLADRLIRGENVTNLTWWSHYVSTMEPRPSLRPNFNNAGFLAFRRRFTQDVALRKIRRIPRPQLYNQDIVIFGGKVKCWEEGRINRQLAALGSSLRLLVVDSDTPRICRIWEKYAQNKAESGFDCPVDGRFILGEVGPMTAFRLATFFDFRQEYAISPYSDAGVSGFTNQNRVVSRREPNRLSFYKFQENSTDTDTRETERTDDEGLDVFHSVSTLVHEYTHIEHDIQLMGLYGTLSSWRDVIKEDLCRFAIKPRTMDDFFQVFAPAYDENDDIAEIGFSETAGIGAFPALEEDINYLLEVGLLRRNKDNKYICSIYSENELWNPLAV